MSKAKLSQTTQAMKRYRSRLRDMGLRPIQIWVPDTRKEGFRAELRRQALLVARDESTSSAERDELDALMAAQDDRGWTS